jgi:hypothetical protein
MSGHMDCIIEQLISFGYIGPNEGDMSDTVVSSSFSGGSNIPSWLELVDEKFFDEEMPPVQAFIHGVGHTKALFEDMGTIKLRARHLGYSF